MTAEHKPVKKLMILGAGIYQLPLIRKAREMGLYTIAVSIPGHYPGFAEADKCLYINTTDVSGILAAAEEEKIDGICTTGTDVCVPALAAVCEALHLPGISVPAASVLSDKCAMKEMFKKGGVRTADFRVAESFEEAGRAAEEIGYPVMAKAPDSSGSRGITKVESFEDLKEAYDEAVKVSRSGRIVVEKCLTGGYEIGLDAFILNGEAVLFLPHNKEVYKTRRAGMPAGHSFPFRGSEALTEELERQLALAVKASGADNCAVNADIMIVDGLPYFLEMGGRCGATGIPEVASYYTGADYYRLIIEAALGQAEKPGDLSARPCMSRLVFSDRTGTITRIDREGLARLKTGLVLDISLDYEEGEKVYLPENGTDRIGQVILATADEEECAGLMAKIGKCIFVDEKPVII